MLASIRGRLVDIVPALARVIGGYYPHIPVTMWEFTLRTNRESTIVWQSPEVTVRCDRLGSGSWVVSSTDRASQTVVESFTEGLAQAYGRICAASDTEVDIIPTRDEFQT